MVINVGIFNIIFCICKKKKRKEKKNTDCRCSLVNEHMDSVVIQIKHAHFIKLVWN